MKKFSFILAAFLLVSTAITACGSTDTPADTGDTGTADTTPAETTASFDPGLPAKTFNGETFTFAVRGKEGAPGTWGNSDIIAAEQNGETLNDAVYERTAYIEETYAVDIDVMWCGESATKLSGSELSNAVTKIVMAGENSIDAILSSPYDSTGFMMNDMLLDLASLEHLDLTKPWWDQNATKSLTVNGRTYITTGELTYIDNIATYTVVFNKEMAELYDIDDPYQAVRDYKWTLDKLISDSKKVDSDMNGNSTVDVEDAFGFISWQDACFGFVHSTGNNFGIINQDGQPELSLYSERLVDVWEKIIAFKQDPAFYQIETNDALLKSYPRYDQAVAYFFDDNRGLYAFSNVMSIVNMRGCDSDFGILPFPMLDESQKQYRATSHGYGTAMLTVPVTTKDAANTGYILEAFCAKSAELVTPAFYDVTLAGKTVRDDESLEMLEIIYANKVYDIGYFFMWGDLTNKVMGAWNGNNANISSMYESAKTAAEGDLENTIKQFTEIDA